MQTPNKILNRSYTKASVPIPTKIDLKQSISNSKKLLTTLIKNNSSKIITNLDTIAVSNMNSPISDNSNTLGLEKSPSISASTSTCSSPNILTKRAIEELFNSDGSQRGVAGMVFQSLKSRLSSINSFAFDVYQRIILFLGAKSQPKIVAPNPIYPPLAPTLNHIVETNAFQMVYLDTSAGSSSATNQSTCNSDNNFNFLELIDESTGPHTLVNKENANASPVSSNSPNHSSGNSMNGFKFLGLTADTYTLIKNKPDPPSNAISHFNNSISGCKFLKLTDKKYSSTKRDKSEIPSHNPNTGGCKFLRLTEDTHTSVKKENTSANINLPHTPVGGFNFLKLTDDNYISNKKDSTSTYSAINPNTSSSCKFLKLLESSSPTIEKHNIDYIWLRIYQILLSNDGIEIQKMKLFELSQVQLGNNNKQAKVEYNIEELELPIMIYFLFLIYCLYLKAGMDTVGKKKPKTTRKAKFNQRLNLKVQCKNYKKIKRYNIIQPV